MARTSQQDVDQLIATYTAAAGRTLVHSPIQNQKEIDNPEFAALSNPRKAIERQKAARGEAAIPEKISVNVQQWQGPDQIIQAYQIPGTGDWEVVAQKNEVPARSAAMTPQQTAMNEEEAAEIRRERSWNLNNGPRTTDPLTGGPGRGSGLNESHAERTKREAAAGTESRAVQDQNWQQEQIARQIENERRRTKIDEQTAALNREKFDADENYRYRPDPISTPTDTTKNIAIWNPGTGKMESVQNPMYDAAKAQAAQLKDQLSTGIALNQITAQQAAQQYKQWWDTNVELPFKQAAEVRARAAEQRAALEAEDRRKQFASDFSLRSSDLGFRAGQAAAENEISLLPYRAGPTAAAEMSAAITSLGKGGKIAGPDASAGINFTPGAFEFDRPDFAKIAQKATKNALKGLTQYSPEGSFSQGDYSGISMPSGEGAPSSTGGGIDLSSLWQSYVNQGMEPYTGPEE